MVTGKVAAAAAFMTLMAAAPALAGDATRAAHAAIARGDMAAAERVLTDERRVFPDRPELLLNLAAVYASTGRPALAADLYGRVLARDDVMMDLTAERSASAHAIARAGLARLAPVQTAAR